MVTAKIRADIVQLFAAWQKVLYLEDWHLLIEFKKLGDVEAITEWPKGYKSAIITVNLNTLNQNLKDDWINHLIIHELLHLKLQPVSDIIDVEFGEGIMKHQFCMAIETSVDTLTNLFLKLAKEKNIASTTQLSGVPTTLLSY